MCSQMQIHRTKNKLIEAIHALESLNPLHFVYKDLACSRVCLMEAIQIKHKGIQLFSEILHNYHPNGNIE